MANSSDNSITIQIILDLIGAGKIEEAKKELATLASSAGQLGNETSSATNATAGFTREMGGLADATKGLDLKKRELLESMRLVTSQFPIMGEAARAFFNPTTASLFAIIGAFALWKNRVDEMVQTLGALTLPDLSDGIRQAQAAAAAYNSLAQAVKAANEAFNSVDQSQGRTTKAANDQQDVQKKRLEAQKQLAEAKLKQKLDTGQISQGDYDSKVAALDQGASDKSTQMDIDARNAELYRKKRSVTEYQNESKGYQTKADELTKKYGLGQNDEVEAAHNKAQQDIIDARQQSIDKSRANLALLNEATSDDTGAVKGTADYAKLIAHYGAGVVLKGGPQKAMSQEQANITENENAQKEMAAQMAERKAALKQRDDYLQKRDESGGKAQTAWNETKDQDNPNIPGTVAWHNAQDLQTQKLKDQTAKVQSDTKIQGRAVSDDRELREFSHGRGGDATKAVQNIAELIQLLKENAGVVSAIASLPIGQIRADIQAANQKIKQLSGQVQGNATSQ